VYVRCIEREREREREKGKGKGKGNIIMIMDIASLFAISTLLVI